LVDALAAVLPARALVGALAAVAVAVFAAIAVLLPFFTFFA
jgi:hypothetical protein